MIDSGGMSADQLTKAAMDRLMQDVYARGGQPQVILMDPKPAAGTEALLKLAGRDRRRLKREWNKAWRLASKKQIAEHTSPLQSINPWWRRDSTK